MKIGIDNGGNWTAEYYEATVVSVVDYYPFGSAMAGWKYNQGSYRYGFNGKEEDSEWGSQMIQDYGFRIYNPTIGKFLSVDPLTNSYPWYTPYQFAGNMPIWAVDLDGLEELIYLKSFDKYKKGIMDVINSDKELLAKYNSYQDKTKNNIKIYIDVVGLAGMENGNTWNVSGEIHYFKEVEDYISSGGKLADFTKSEIVTYNEGKGLANRLGLQTKDISLTNEYEIVTINARTNRPAEVGQKDTKPYTWDKLLFSTIATLFHEIDGHVIYSGATGIDEHNYLYDFDKYEYPQEESHRDPKKRTSPYTAGSKSVLGEIQIMIRRAINNLGGTLETPDDPPLEEANNIENDEKKDNQKQ
jgi:RHS repeat-associated protein